MDAVEEILVQQMHAEMQADNSDRWFAFELVYDGA